MIYFIWHLDFQHKDIQEFLREFKKVSKLFLSVSHVHLCFSLNRTGNRKRKCCGGAIMRKLDPSGKLSRSNLTHRAANFSNTMGDMAHAAVNTIRKPN